VVREDAKRRTVRFDEAKGFRIAEIARRIAKTQALVGKVRQGDTFQDRGDRV
jgi:hypothetical protein